MRPIPRELRRELEIQLRMKRCILSDLQNVYGTCGGRIEWDHVWIYAGKQINEEWAIIGACQYHHSEKEGDPAIKAAFKTASLLLASPEDLAKYPRKDWGQIKKALNIQSV